MLTLNKFENCNSNYLINNLLCHNHQTRKFPDEKKGLFLIHHTPLDIGLCSLSIRAMGFDVTPPVEKRIIRAFAPRQTPERERALPWCVSIQRPSDYVMIIILSQPTRCKGWVHFALESGGGGALSTRMQQRALSRRRRDKFIYANSYFTTCTQGKSEFFFWLGANANSTISSLPCAHSTIVIQINCTAAIKRYTFMARTFVYFNLFMTEKLKYRLGSFAAGASTARETAGMSSVNNARGRKSRSPACLLGSAFSNH
jgi:hypothetical protein